MTRRNLFIDRLAALWLIKRFIDPKARFFFVAEGETVEGAIGFDLYGGEFTHRGEDCTFETMLKEFGLTDDAGLRALAEIVHDLDLKDGKFNRSEAELGEIIAGHKPGRETREEIIIYDSTGVALQDVAAAALVYERAVQMGCGVRLDFAV